MGGTCGGGKKDGLRGSVRQRRIRAAAWLQAVVCTGCGAGEEARQCAAAQSAGVKRDGRCRRQRFPPGGWFWLPAHSHRGAAEPYVHGASDVGAGHTGTGGVNGGVREVVGEVKDGVRACLLKTASAWLRSRVMMAATPIMAWGDWGQREGEEAAKVMTRGNC